MEAGRITTLGKKASETGTKPSEYRKHDKGSAASAPPCFLVYTSVVLPVDRVVGHALLQFDVSFRSVIGVRFLPVGSRLSPPPPARLNRHHIW